MSNIGLKGWLMLVGAMVINVFLVWFGVKMLLLDNTTSVTQLFLLGCIGILGGVFVLSSTIVYKEIWSIILLLAGVYYFARASGLIENPVLVRILGAASIVAAIVLTYSAAKYIQQRAP